MKSLGKAQLTAWQLWFSRCRPAQKHFWKRGFHRWSEQDLQLIADYVAMKFMGLPGQPAWIHIWLFYSRLVMAYLMTPWAGC